MRQGCILSGVEQSPLHTRLEAAAGDRTYRMLGELTGVHPENVRRYMQGQSPSVQFLTGFCSALGVSATWLLTGHGPMLAADVKGHVLKSAAASDLLGAMAGQLEAMRSRLERVELYVQTLETRLRADRAGDSPRGAFREVKPLDAAVGHPPHAMGSADGQHAATGSAVDRIAAAVTKRPSPPAH